MSSYGFFPAPGTNYSVGDEPTIANRLDRLAKALRLHLQGVSGFRTPQHSVEVGGFADDPHTRGKASDTPGIESVPESTLERFGLTRPFGGTSEADHIQLLSKGSAARNPRRPSGTQSLASLWRSNGGPGNLAPIMAAIAEAESGGRVDAVGGPNSDGSYDYGLWQINSSHTQFDESRLVSDPNYNARAAVSIYRSQGLGAWSTYVSGAYKSFMGAGNNYQPTFGRTRPGGSQDDPGAQAETIFASYLAGDEGSASGTETVGLNLNPLPFGPSLNVPGIPSFDPLSIFKDASGVVSDTASFLKWIAWLFHPRNILRVVEFLTGFTLVLFGVHIAIKAHFGEDPVTKGVGKATSAASLAIPGVGEEVAAVKGARAGRRAEKASRRRARFNESSKTGRRESAEKRRLREADRRFGREAPF